MDDPPRPDRQRSVLLLPGFCSPAEVMRPLGRRLERHLGCAARIVSLGSACGDIRDLAERAHVALDELPAGAGVDVIGHSMGGLVAAYLLKCLDQGRRVHRVVTLGTPHRGLPIARIGHVLPGPIGRTLRQLRPGSSLLALLARLALPEGSELVSVAGLADGLVPASATRVPDAAGQRNVELAAVDHLGLVLSKRGAELLTGVLGPPRAEPGRRPPQRPPRAARAGRAEGSWPRGLVAARRAG